MASSDQVPFELIPQSCGIFFNAPFKGQEGSTIIRNIGLRPLAIAIKHTQAVVNHTKIIEPQNGGMVLQPGKEGVIRIQLTSEDALIGELKGAPQEMQTVKSNPEEHLSLEIFDVPVGVFKFTFNLLKGPKDRLWKRPIQFYFNE